MQNRYAGDVGDFLKLGLLRHLAAAPTAEGAGLSIALNWYLAPDEAHNADGKHVAYLNPANRQHQSLASCDPDLVQRLSRVVASGRSVEALEASGALPPGCATYHEMLLTGEDPAARLAWHHRALAVVDQAEVVCTDPDNGICFVPCKPKLHKYALIAELADYARRGQSLVAYQHADRSAYARDQAVQRLEDLATAVDQTPVATIIGRRGSCRFFLVTAADGHAARLTAALRAFADRWSPHAELIVLGARRACRG
jgi:hypothetical protein